MKLGKTPKTPGSNSHRKAEHKKYDRIIAKEFYNSLAERKMAENQRLLAESRYSCPIREYEIKKYIEAID